MISFKIFLMLYGLFSALNDYVLASPGHRCTTIISAFPPDSTSGCCGVGTGPLQRLEGSGTEIDEYPWLAQIEYLNKNNLTALCGATLISGKYVVTAAHCVTGSVIKVNVPKNVILGEYDTSHEGPDCVQTPFGGEDCTDGALKIPIEKIVPHPQYEENGSSRRNDIALVRMSKMAPYTDFIRPICLPTSDITLTKEPRKLLEFATWGITSERSPVKVQVFLPFVPQEKCQQVYSPSKIQLWKGQLCAGGEEGKDSCKGDAGLPLMNDSGRKYEVVGLVSFGFNTCGVKNIPSVYTNVYEYNSWIMSRIEA